MSEHDDVKQSPNTALLDAVFKPVTESYYTERVKSGGNARLRAQAAQSTISLFVGGVIAAFSITSLRDSAAPSRWAAAVAITCWLASSVLYMRAVAAPLKDPLYDTRVKNQGDLVDLVLKHAIGEVKHVDRRQRAANLVAVVAVAATAFAFVTAVTVNVSPAVRPGEMVIAPTYLAALNSLCPGSGGMLRGEIETDTIGRTFVKIQPASALCGGRVAQIYVPQADVVSLVTFGG